ncbi:MAG: NAD(P)/FAD-dependent oxidoreductase [Gammaproteobacteria bacterium]|nr:NAD(P)/FAD-dependent oxidoreductase [Gammaproteobacteria bacterium]
MTTQAQPADPLDFDPEALRRKYREERDRRLRPDGNRQYVEIAGEFSRYIDDPYVAPGFTRAPLNDAVDVIIIGGGFGGLLAGARLRDAGVESIRVIERGGDFGGTWYWNRYPGAQCDIESYIYLPLLEELGYVPKEKYSHAPEILAHAQAIARHFRLYDNACLQTQVTEMRWDETAQRWIIRTDRGDRMSARFVAMSNGPLNRPKLPGIPGISTFQGHTFHTSRWDYDYTGGSAAGNLHRLRDKRVGIIGTGATAVQCIPHLGEAAEHLYVFQRTPSSVDIRNNRATDGEWVRGLKPGWHRERMENFNALVSGGYQQVDLVHDGWTEIFRNLANMTPKDGEKKMSASEHAQALELADFRKMQQVRARVDEVVRDEATAEALKPWYRQFCKRPCFHDEYLQTYNRANVTLVDTQGQGVDRITATGVVVGGTEYAVDCLIFATGFEVATNYTHKSGYDLIGRDGIRLSEKWAAGLATYHGFYSHGFPNCFFMGMTQTGFTANFTHMLKEQAEHIAFVIRQALDQGIDALEATAEAEADWVATINRLARVGARYYAECTPGYYNNEGKVGEDGGFLAGQYGRGPMEFFRILSDWRAEGQFRGLDIRRKQAS